MVKILFLCWGNICRSPMAEFIFNDMANKRGADDRFHADSAAVSSEEIINGVGNPVYPPARKILNEHGISCGEKRAVMMRKEDYGKYDRLICMDRKNIRTALRILGSDPDHKLSLLLDHTERRGEEVADPWYTGDYKEAWDDIYEGCEGLLDLLMSE